MFGMLAYRPTVEWACLFSSDTDCIRTELLRDSHDKDSYMTID